MLRLRPYKACDADGIVGWIKSEYAFRQWCADRYERYPITADDINKYYDKDSKSENIWAMTAFDESGIVGHLIMRFTDREKKNLRFGFVIVDDCKRGQGYGKEMISLAIRYAFNFIKVEKISLGVFEKNEKAIKCYESVGFNRIHLEKQESYKCLNEIWNCIEMELKNEITI